MHLHKIKYHNKTSRKEFNDNYSNTKDKIITYINNNQSHYSKPFSVAYGKAITVNSEQTVVIRYTDSVRQIKKRNKTRENGSKQLRTRGKDGNNKYELLCKGEQTQRSNNK